MPRTTAGSRSITTLIISILTFPYLVYAQNPALNTDQLESLLKASSTEAVYYEERRESPWLDAPQYSRGTLSIVGAVLIKNATSPRKETWSLHPEHIEVIPSLNHTEATPEPPRQIIYTQAPGIGVLANALRAAVMGELVALPDHFVLELTGTELGWSLALTPKRPEDQRALTRIEFHGAGAGIETIVITEPNGGKTTTTLLRRPHS